MSAATFTSPSYVVTDDEGNVVPGMQFTVWTAKTGGTQVTSLTDLDGEALPGYVTTDAKGRCWFADPEARDVLYVQPPGTPVPARWIVISDQAQIEVGQAIDQAGQAFTIATQAKTTADAAVTTATGADGRSVEALRKAESALVASGQEIVGQQSPLIVAHRGGGGLVWPEESIEALDAAAASGFAVEVDVQPLGDGTLVCCHDRAADRTMTITGQLTSLTLQDWENAQVKPTIPGGRYGTPATFEQILDRFGGRILLVPELEIADSADQDGITAFIDAITDRRLEQAVIAQAFHYDVAVQIAASGIRTMLLVDDTIPTDPPLNQVVEDGITYLGPTLDMTAEDITTAHDADLQVVGWTAETPAEQAAFLAKGADGVFSDDPWATSGRIPKSGTDPWRAGCRPYGLQYVDASAPVSGLPTPSAAFGQPRLIGGGIGLDNNTSPADAPTAVLSCDWAGEIDAPFTISGRFHLGAGSVAGASMGFVLVTNEIASFVDAANPGQDGWTWVCRKDGRLGLWSYDDGSAPASLGSTSALSSSVDVDSEVVVDLSMTLGGGRFLVSASTPWGQAFMKVTTGVRSLSGLHLGVRQSLLGYAENVTVTRL